MALLLSPLSPFSSSLSPSSSPVAFYTSLCMCLQIPTWYLICSLNLIICSLNLITHDLCLANDILQAEGGHSCGPGLPAAIMPRELRMLRVHSHYKPYRIDPQSSSRNAPFWCESLLMLPLQPIG